MHPKLSACPPCSYQLHAAENSLCGTQSHHKTTLKARAFHQGSTRWWSQPWREWEQLHFRGAHAPYHSLEYEAHSHTTLERSQTLRWLLKTFMDYHRISNRLSELHWWRTVIFPSHPVSLCNRVTGNSQVPVTGWFKFFPSGFQILLKLDFNLEMPLLDFFLIALKKEKNPFSRNLSTEYFEYIWSHQWKFTI